MIGGVNASSSLKANKMYDTNNTAEREKQKVLSKGSDRSIIPGPVIDEFFFVPNKSIGLKLLKSLGWKETSNENSRYKHNHPPIKDNLYGLGYNYDTANAGFIKHKLSTKNNEKKVKYSRQTHITHDHDDYSDTDVYEDTIHRQYDHMLDDSASDAEAETGIGNQVTTWLQGQVTQLCPTDGKEVLRNFVLATDGLQRLQITEYPLIQAPKGYNPTHYFAKDKKPTSRWGDTELAPGDARATSRFTVSKVLGDVPTFDATRLTTPQLQGAAATGNGKAGESSKPASRWGDTQLVPGAAIAPKVDDIPKFDATQIVIPQSQGAAANGSAAAGNVERPMLVSERVQSRFAGLANFMKNKFAPSTDGPSAVGATDSAVNIASKRLPSRVTTIWYPEALLCKRFNVPRPALATSAPSTTVASASAGGASDRSHDNTATTAVSTTISELASTISYPLQQERPAASLFDSIFGEFDSIINTVERRLAPKAAAPSEQPQQKPALSFDFDEDEEKGVQKAIPSVATKATVFRRIKRDRSVSPEVTVALPPSAPPAKASSTDDSSTDSSSDSSSHKKSKKSHKKRHKNKKKHHKH